MSIFRVIDPYRTEPDRSMSAWLGRTLRESALYALGARQVGTSVSMVRFVESGPEGVALSTHPDGESWPSLIPYLVPSHPTDVIRASVTCAVGGDVRLRLVDLASGVTGEWVDLSTGTHDAELELPAGPVSSASSWRPIALQILSLIDDSTIEAVALDDDHLDTDQIELTPVSLDPEDVTTPCALLDDEGRPLLHITWAEAHGPHYDVTLWPAGAAESLLRDVGGDLRTDIQIARIGRIGIESIAIDCYDTRPIADDVDTSGALPAEHAIRSGAIVYGSQVAGIDEAIRHVYVTRPRWITADAQQMVSPSSSGGAGTGTVATRSGGGRSGVGTAGAYTLREDVTGLRLACIVAPAPMVSQAGTLVVIVTDPVTSTQSAISVPLPDWYAMSERARADASADRIWQVASDWDRVWYGVDASTVPGAYPVVEVEIDIPPGMSTGTLLAVLPACRDWLGYVLAVSVTEIVGVER